MAERVLPYLARKKDGAKKERSAKDGELTAESIAAVLTEQQAQREQRRAHDELVESIRSLLERNIQVQSQFIDAINRNTRVLEIIERALSNGTATLSDFEP